MLDHSPLLGQINAWKEAERSGPGGRPVRFPTRALLVAIIVAALTGGDMLATDFCDVLFRRFSPEMRAQLGVPHPPDPNDQKGWLAAYRNVRTRIHGLLGLMDPSPAPKNRRLDPATFEAMLEARLAELSEEEWAERADRLTWFLNHVLEMSIEVLPRDLRRAWKGSVGVDATPIPTFARPARRERRWK